MDTNTSPHRKQVIPGLTFRVFTTFTGGPRSRFGLAIRFRANSTRGDATGTIGVSWRSRKLRKANIQDMLL
jgi:hypothetical protein